MRVKEEISAQNTFTAAVPIPVTGVIDLSIGGTFSATVTVQRYIGKTWRAVDTFTAADEKKISGSLGMKYRVGVATGDYTSGTVEITLQN